MFPLPLSVQAWQTDGFNAALKKEIKTIDANHLPLQQGLSHSNFANGDNVSATIMHSKEINGSIHIKAGLFYTGIIAGCNCADDPTPVDEINEYCEVSLIINLLSAQCKVTLIKE